MNLYVFDVDGVLTDPLKKETNPELLKKLSDILAKGDLIAFNTGRSISWVDERILARLASFISEKLFLKRMFIVGEKGNTLKFFNEGDWETKILTESLPKKLSQTIQHLIKDKFSQTTFFDESKQTMISTEMKDGVNHSAYTKDQQALNDELEKLLTSQEFKHLQLRIDPTVIALDVQNGKAGKHLGAQRIEKWLQNKGYKPESVFMIGDSQSDIEMAEELGHLYPVTFVFVNEPHKLSYKKGTFKVLFTKEKFEKGTLEFLNT